MPTDIHSPDYADLERALRVLGDLSAAEAHGIVSGVVSAPQPSAAAWTQALLAEFDPAGDSTEAERLLAALRAQTLAQLAARASEFSPLLPDSERDFNAQVAALADFCRGFIVGLVAGGVRELANLPADVREIIEDFVKIAEAEVTDAAGETEERAFVELTEYVRVGVQLIYEQLHAD